MSMTSAQRLEAAERRKRALELRKQGKLLREIAVELGIHPSSARRIIYEAMTNLDDSSKQDAAELRHEELADLYLLEEELMAKFFGGSASLEVLDRIIKIKERRAKLTGIDAPVRSETKNLTLGFNFDSATTEELVELAKLYGVRIPDSLSSAAPMKALPTPNAESDR